jgi:hypothetical protein
VRQQWLHAVLAAVWAMLFWSGGFRDGYFLVDLNF